MKGFWRLTVRDHFSAAHALRNYHGKCENPHGHNFEVEASVEGSRLDEATGMLLDFGILKRILKDVLAGLDHCDLNELPIFKNCNPSSENLARHICGKMASALSLIPEAGNVRLMAVSVSEKATQTATWFAEDFGGEQGRN